MTRAATLHACSWDDISDDIVTCLDGLPVTALDDDCTTEGPATLELYVDADPSR